MPPFSGKLAERSLAQVLSRVLGAGRSGVLKIVKGTMIRQLFVEKGTVIRYAASNLLPESLSEHLKQQGQFQAEQIRKATASKQPHELLSSAMLRLGFLTPEAHQTLVREMIEKVVVGAARWSDAAYEYQEGELPFTQPGDAGLPVPVAILGLVRHATDLVLLRSVLADDRRAVRLNATPPMPLERIPLEPTEGFLVSRADGTLTLREIGVTSPLGQDETDRALSGLLLAGILKLEGVEAEVAGPQAAPVSVADGVAREESRPRAAARPSTLPPPPPRKPAGPVEEMLERYAALKGQTLYQVLGVPAAAPDPEIRHAYYTLAKRLHPDKFSDEETKTRAEKVFAAITEAYATLSRPESRREYDQSVIQPSERQKAESVAASATELARQNFLHGKVLFERHEVVKALPFFEHAVEQDPTKEEYRRHLAMVQIRNPRLRKEAEQNFLKAIELNPTFAENYAQLGLLYRKMGQEARANECLQKALSWDAANETAREALGEDDPRKGILKGLFRK